MSDRPKSNHTSEFFERARYEEVLKDEINSVLRAMITKYGFDVVLPVLESLASEMDKADARGEIERLI